MNMAPRELSLNARLDSLILDTRIMELKSLLLRIRGESITTIDEVIEYLERQSLVLESVRETHNVPARDE